MKCVITVAFCLAVTPLAPGQSTLDELVAEALENNPEIAAAKASWEAAKARAPQMRALMDPMFGADVERSGTTSFDDYMDIEYMVQQDIPWFGKRGLAGRAEEAMARQAEMRARMTELEIVSMVKRMAYDLWQVEGEIVVNLANQELMRQFVESASDRYEAGQASQADVLNARTALAVLAEAQADLVRMRENANADLNRFVGRAPGTPFNMLHEDLVPAFKLNLDELRRCSSDTNPDLLGAKQGMVASARARYDLSRKIGRPDLQVRVEARQFEGSGDIEEYDTALFLSFPWFNRSRNRAAVAEAKASLRSAELGLQGMQLRNNAEVEKLYHGIHTMQHHYDLFIEKVLPQQRAAVDAARAAYESGGMSLLDLLEAQRMLLDLEMQNLHHAAETFRLAADLEVLMGGKEISK
jgi:outer membrane protein TolC